MGGGGSKKEQTINEKVMSDIANSVSATIQQNCAARVTSEQVISVVGDNNVILNVIQKGFFSVDASCKITQEIVNELIAELASKFTAVMEQNQDALSETLKTMWGGLTGSKEEVKQKMNREVELIMKNSITAEVIQNCAASIESKQQVLVQGHGNIISGVTQSIMSDVALQCLSNNSAVNTMKSKLISSSAYDQKYEEKGPFDWIGDALSEFWNMIIIVFVLLILLAFVYMIYRRSAPIPQISA